MSEHSALLECDHYLEVERSRPVLGVEAGDRLAVKEATAADDGRLVVAKTEAGEYTLTRAPVADGLAVVGVVVGLVRSLA